MDSATTQGGSRDLSKGPEHHWSEQAGAGGLDLRKDGVQPPLRMQGLLAASRSLCPTVQLQTEAQGLPQVDSRIIKQSWGSRSETHMPDIFGGRTEMRQRP